MCNMCNVQTFFLHLLSNRSCFINGPHQKFEPLLQLCTALVNCDINVSFFTTSTNIRSCSRAVTVTKALLVNASSFQVTANDTHLPLALRLKKKKGKSKLQLITAVTKKWARLSFSSLCLPSLMWLIASWSAKCVSLNDCIYIFMFYVDLNCFCLLIRANGAQSV